MGRWRSERGQETWGGGGVRGEEERAPCIYTCIYMYNYIPETRFPAVYMYTCTYSMYKHISTCKVQRIYYCTRNNRNIPQREASEGRGSH